MKMDKDYTKWELAAKIGEARALVNQLSDTSRVNHASHCAIETDPEGYSPCSCGASRQNSASGSIKQRLLKVLSL